MRYQLARPEDFGTAIAEFRAVRGVSQVELANLVGLNRTYLSNLENGETPAFVERFMALAKALGLTVTISDDV